VNLEYVKLRCAFSRTFFDYHKELLRSTNTDYVSIYRINPPIGIHYLYIYIYVLVKLPNGHLKLFVSVMPSCGRGSKNPNTIKLKDWHPATGGNVDSTNDPNVNRVDSALPDSPAIKFRRLSPTLLLRCNSGSLSTNTCHKSTPRN